MITKIYLKEELQSQMRDAFFQNGTIQLTGFISQEKVDKLYEILKKLNFEKISIPDYISKNKLDLDEATKVEVFEILEFFKSNDFKEFLENTFEIGIELENIEICKYKQGDYRILNDLYVKKEDKLDIIFDITKKWSKNSGGNLVYTTKEEELMILSPEYNTLSVIFRPSEIMSYLKYVNNKAKGNEIIRIEMSFKLD